ncbi:MAG: phosphotransferase [Clostridia bacterium]|jgi:tRNA A-37 threonylcarbamoyl transferase component Bud32|nr:phosphotransferase [Clostridia bacterium]
MNNQNLKLVFERADKKIYREGDKLIKVFDANYSKANILNEALNHARVEETDLNVPKLQAVQVVDGKWAIVLDYIEGKTLQQLMDEHPEKEDEYLELFVDLQLNALSKKVPMLNKLRDKFQAKISATADVLDATTRYDLHTRLDSMPKHTHLCHGDFNPTNIIITKDGTPYIIDWSHATQGNSSADVARSYLLFYLAGNEALGDKYLKLFCKKSDTAIQYVQRWIPIVAAARLTKAPKEEEEFLHRWIDVVDYE